MTFEHVTEPLRLRASDLRELRGYLQTGHPGKAIVSIRDEDGKLAGTPPFPVTGSGAGPWRVAVAMTLTLGGLAYGLSWLLT